MSKLMIGYPTVECESGTPGAKFNEYKGTYFLERDKPDATFFDRDMPEEKSFSGKVVKPLTKGKSYPAIIGKEWQATNARGYPKTYAKLTVNFGPREGWKEITAVLQDGGEQGKQSYVRGYNAPNAKK
jgi:hypothetical protein